MSLRTLAGTTKRTAQRVIKRSRLAWDPIGGLADWEIGAALMRHAAYLSYQPTARGYTLPAFANQAIPDPTSILPMPASITYGTSHETWRQSGADDIGTMRAAMAAAGSPLEATNRLLDLGCSSGRMLRHLIDLAPTREYWGVDILAEEVMWCREHLCPPFHVAVTTVNPHLPFEDRYFDHVYAGSVFTHIDDTVDAWFAELHRITRPGGTLYISINDRHACDIFTGRLTPARLETYKARVNGEAAWDHWCQVVQTNPHIQTFVRGEAAMAVIDRGWRCHVLWDADALCARLSPRWTKLAWLPEAYGHQSCLLLKRT